MPNAPVIHAAAVSALALAGLEVGVVELWDESGRVGLAAAAGAGAVEATLAVARTAIGRPVIESTPDPADRWLEPSPAWIGAGAVATARADLAARIAAVPLWLWLGGKARARLGPTGSWEGIRTAAAPSPAFAALDRALLDRTVDRVLVAPVAIGGPPAVVRLDGIARAFQIELELVAETPLVLSHALAIHLSLATGTATLGPDLATGVGASFPWLIADDQAGLASDRLPSAAGLGVRLDRVALVASGARRFEVG